MLSYTEAITHIYQGCKSGPQKPENIGIDVGWERAWCLLNSPLIPCWIWKQHSGWGRKFEEEKEDMMKAAEWCPGELAAISVPAEEFLWNTAKSSKPYIESFVSVIVGVLFCECIN